MPSSCHVLSCILIWKLLWQAMSCHAPQLLSPPAGDKFALAEDEPGGDVLTHFGSSIADDNALGVSIAIPVYKTLSRGLACGTNDA